MANQRDSDTPGNDTEIGRATDEDVIASESADEFDDTDDMEDDEDEDEVEAE